MSEKALIAFHGDKAIKQKYIDRVVAHRKADELVQGATGRGGKGCAVWCTLNAYNHRAYEEQLGIPQVLARLEDGIFEGLPVEESMAWPQNFLNAIKPGADLSLVWPAFALWLLIDPKWGVLQYANNEATKLAIKAVAAGYALWLKGKKPSVDEWRKMRADAAAADAADAAAAAYAAAYADAAYAAAAAAAAYAYARKKTRFMHRIAQSKKLISLLKKAKKKNA